MRTYIPTGGVSRISRKGYVEIDPMRGIARNRRTAFTRFLSRGEIGRLHMVLDADTGKNNRLQADTVRLLPLSTK